MYGREFFEWQEARREQNRYLTRAADHLAMAHEHAEFALVCTYMADGAMSQWEKRWVETHTSTPTR